MNADLCLEEIKLLCLDDGLRDLSLEDLFSIYSYLDKRRNYDNMIAEIALMKDIVELTIQDICASKSKIFLRV